MIHEEDSKLGSKKNKENFTENYNANKEEIKSLKAKLSELQKYCGALEVRVGNEIFQTSPTSTMIFAEQEKIHHEQVEFHKAQTRDF